MTPSAIILLGLAIAAGIAGCETPQSRPEERVSPLPPVCWLYRPATKDRVGSVGIARTVAIGGPKRVTQLARQRAVAGLAAYLGLEQPDPDALDNLVAADSDIVALGGHNIHFVDSIDWLGYRYEYAVLDAPGLSRESLRKGCTGQCKPWQCEPGWLCDPMTDDEAALLGVSFRATSLPAQYQVALDNALEQLRYFYGVQVQSRGQYIQGRDSLGSYRVRVQDIDVSPSSAETPEDIRLLVTNGCLDGEQLYLRVASPDLPTLRHGGVTDWINRPNRSGYEGAVGIASLTSDGQLASQIGLAIKRAFGELAGAEHTGLSDTLTYRHGRDGRTVLWELRTEGKAVVAGRIMGIRFEPQDSYRTRVYVWVVKEQ